MIIVAIFVGFGAVLSRAATTVNTLQSVSTPPLVVSLLPEDIVTSVVPPESAAALTLASDAPVQTVVQPAPPAAVTTDQLAQPVLPDQLAQPLVIDTAPARDAMVAAGIVGGGDGGLLDTFHDQAGGIADLSQGAAAFAGAEQIDLEPMTILLMGVDARPGEAIDIGVRPDALAVLRLDPESGSCRMLNIPRDTRVNLPGYGLTKVNHALAVGGIPYQELVVEEFLGITIDQYALIDFGGVEALVDAVGGVTITVTEPFEQNGVTFAVGEREVDGVEALAYASYRGGPDGDFGRIRRQQQIVRAILAKGSELDPVTLVRELLPELQDHVRTDLSPLDLVALGSRFLTSCTDETLVTMNLEGTVATYDDPLFGVPLSYVVVADDEVRRKVAELTATQ